MAKQHTEAREEDVLEDGAEPRVYELGFHLSPELPSEEVKSAYEAMRARVAEAGAIVAEGRPQAIPLAYTISRQGSSGAPGRRDFNSAYFCWIAYEMPASSHAEVIEAANADARIIRFIDLLTTKDAARHAAEVREFSQKTADRSKERESERSPQVDLDTALERTAEV